MFTVGIISAPRKVNYISDSLDSYFREWGVRPTVFEEPGVINYSNHSKVSRCRNPETKGCVKNWLDGLEILAREETPWYMLCEDDIYWSPNSGQIVRAFVFSLNVKTNHFVSPYCSLINRPRGIGWGKPEKMINWCGALCSIMSRPMVEHILTNKDKFLDASRDEYFSDALKELVHHSNNLRHLDTAIGTMCAPYACHTHAPTLILHLGKESAINPDRRHKHLDARLPAL
jgi:hypothetical protein